MKAAVTRAAVAALFVRSDGPYPALCDEYYDGSPGRDARDYRGPLPVVAHPPCARWGGLAGAVESRYGYAAAEDGGCFAAALAAVRRWGGALEHPESSRAWARFGLHRPVAGRWTEHPDRPGEWTTRVDQSAYGHPARKRTWLLYVGRVAPPPMDWSSPPVTAYVASGPGKSATSASRKAHGIRLCTRREREVTPDRFAAALVALALGALVVIEEGQ